MGPFEESAIERETLVPGPVSPDTLVGHLPFPLWVVRVRDGRCLYSNPALRELTGRDAGPSSEKWWGRFHVSADDGLPFFVHRETGTAYPHRELLIEPTVRTRSPTTVDDLAVQRPDGQQVPVRATASPLFSPNGDIDQVLVACCDITKELQSDRARQQAETTTQALSQWAPALVFAPFIFFVLELDGVITILDGPGLLHLKVKAEGLRGRSVFEVFPTRQVHQAVRRALAGESFTDVLDLRSLVINAAVWPRRGSDGAISGIAGVGLDITEQLRLRKQLVQADRLAALGTMAAGVAHEVNTPLAYAITHLELLEKELRALPMLDASQRERLLSHVLAARDGTGRVARIAKDLNVYSRGETEERLTVDPREALRAAISLAQAQLNLSRALLSQRLDPTPPVDVSPEQLSQVFLNLLLNAAQALGDGEGTKREVSVISGTGPSGEAVFEVQDSGHGIRADNLERIFDPFFTTKPVGSGTGLGLSVSKRIIEGFGGNIEVMRTGREGTVFRVTLPASRGVREIAARPVEKRAHRPKVLIVDDDVNLGRVFVMALSSDCDAQVCQSARDALTLLLKDTSYDLVLCDVMMRDVSGIELYGELKKARPGLEQRLVFMTGGVFSPVARDFLSSVSNLCLTKPFDVREAVLGALRTV